MFFVLSGFVISLAYEDKLKAGCGLGAFMTARVERLLPVQTIGTLLSAASFLALSWHTDGVIGAWVIATVAALALVPLRWMTAASIFPHWRGEFPVNPPIWSLQCEWIVNAAYGLFLFAWSVPRLAMVATIAAAYIVGISFSTLGWASSGAGIGRASFGFVLGIIVYRYSRCGAFARIPTVSPALVYAVWFLISCAPAWGRYPVMQAVPASLTSAVIIALLVRNEKPVGKVLHHFGRLSFPLYASHFAVVNMAMLVSGEERQSLLWAIPMVVASLVLAQFVHRVTSAGFRYRRERWA
jgi:peptidoglycan/LPS O-acetylase OafA/YrhL